MPKHHSRARSGLLDEERGPLRKMVSPSSSSPLFGVASHMLARNTRPREGALYLSYVLLRARGNDWQRGTLTFTLVSLKTGKRGRRRLGSGVRSSWGKLENMAYWIWCSIQATMAQLTVRNHGGKVDPSWLCTCTDLRRIVCSVLNEDKHHSHCCRER